MKKIPILVLHGWNLSAEKLKPLTNELKKRKYKVLCFDLPGFGKSPSPKSALVLSDYVDFVISKLEKNKIKKIFLVGHSFGGRIGIKLSYLHPNIVKGMVLSGTPGINPVPKAKILFFIYIAKIGNLFFKLPIISSLSNKAKILLYKAAGARDFYNTDINMRTTFKNIIREDLVKFMSNISIPVLLLWGENDGIVPKHIAQKMSALIKRSDIKFIKNARHAVPWTHPVEFASKVEEFISRL